MCDIRGESEVKFLGTLPGSHTAPSPTRFNHSSSGLSYHKLPFAPSNIESFHFHQTTARFTTNMAATRIQGQQASTKGKRKTAEDSRPTTRDKRRKLFDHETSIPSENQIPKKQIPGKGHPKRKHDDDDESPPRKRSKTQNRVHDYQTRPTYREPQGARKSRRIAGQPADASGTTPGGQYAQQVNQGAILREVIPENLLPEVQEAQDQQPDNPVVQRSSLPQDESERDDQGESRGSEQVREFLKVLANNICSHRMMQLLTSSYTRWTQNIADLNDAEGGLTQVEKQIRLLEDEGDGTREDLEDLKYLRDRRITRLKQIEDARDHVSTLAEPMNDLNAKQANRNERMYEFADVSKESKELAFLPDEFWLAFDDCTLANTVCKDIEQEMRQVEQKQLDVFQLLDDQSGNAAFSDDGNSSQNGDAIRHTAFEQTYEEIQERVRGLNDASRQLGHLRNRLDVAKDTRYDRESKSIQIAEGAFIGAGFMSAVTALEGSKVIRRTAHLLDPSKQNSEEKGQLRTETGDPLLTAEYMEKSNIASKVDQAREAVKWWEERLETFRFESMSDAGSMDPDVQGQAHMREVVRITQEIRAAQDRYRVIFHEALSKGAIGRGDQESQFQDRSSDGYNDSDLGLREFPLPAAKNDRVNRWAESIGRSRKETQATQDGHVKDKEGSWVERVSSLDLDEETCTRRSDRRFKDYMEQHRRACEHLRATGPFEKAENDFHPKNNPAHLEGVQIDRSNLRIPTELDVDKDEIQPSRDKSRVPSGRNL